MRSYDKYKPSGVEWIGEIPEEWGIAKLKRIAKIKTGYTPPKIDEGNYSEDGIIWVKPDNLDQFHPISDSKEKVSSQGLKEQNLVPPGSVLVCCIGSIGKFGIAGTNLVTNQQINSVTFSNVIYDGFGKYLIFAAEQEHLRLANGNVVKILNTENQGSIFFCVPPISEQTAIANYLDDKTAKIDSLIEKKKKLIELLREERTAVINEAVTKGLNYDSSDLSDYLDSKNHSNYNNQKNHSADRRRMKDSGIEWLGKMPEHWEVKKLKYVLSIKSGDGIKSEDIDFEGTYPVYGGNGVMGYTEKYNSEKLDIIVGRVGAKCGNVRLVAGKKWISDNALVAELLGGYDYKYISIVLESINLNSLANQNAQPLITGTLVRDKVVSLPKKITEQQLIVQHIETETKRIDSTIYKIEKEIELLTEYRTALISEVVTGKIKV